MFRKLMSVTLLVAAFTAVLGTTEAQAFHHRGHHRHHGRHHGRYDNSNYGSNQQVASYAPQAAGCGTQTTNANWATPVNSTLAPLQSAPAPTPLPTPGI